MQDPIQAPPGTTRQAGLYTADRAARTCWLGCPGFLYYLAARDAKLSFSPVPSTWLLPPRPHLTSPKVLKSSKPRSKCQFSQGAVRCVIIPIVKTHQTQLHSTQSWSATGLRGRKVKIINCTKQSIIEHKRSNKINNRT
ncbi:hypothetical protein TNCV_4030231 [Trichonephila clavipes]|nr:hypothetical protein TNCV_4030231 [Trichonephila clavipes]